MKGLHLTIMLSINNINMLSIVVVPPFYTTTKLTDVKLNSTFSTKNNYLKKPMLSN